MIAILALMITLSTTSPPQIAYISHDGPAIFSGPGEPVNVPPTFRLAFGCTDWISCAAGYILVIDGVRVVLATDQIDEVLPTSALTHVYETSLTLSVGEHTIEAIGVDGLVESIKSTTLTLRVVAFSPSAPQAPTNVVIRP